MKLRFVLAIDLKFNAWDLMKYKLPDDPWDNSPIDWRWVVWNEDRHNYYEKIKHIPTSLKKLILEAQ